MSGSCRVEKIPVDGRLYRGRVPEANRERFAPDQARLQHFTEERTRWQLPVQSSWQRPVDIACVAGGIHVLTESPIGIHSFWNLGPSAEAGGKTPSRSWLHLEEVLPYNAVRPALGSFDGELVMYLPNMSTLVFLTPKGGEVRVLNLPELPNPFKGSMDKDGETSSSKASMFETMFQNSPFGSIRKKRSPKPRMIESLSREGILVIDGGPEGTASIDILEKDVQRSFPAVTRVHMPEGFIARNLTLCTKHLWFAEVEEVSSGAIQPCWLVRSESGDETLRNADQHRIAQNCRFDVLPISKRALSLEEALSSLDSLDYPGIAGAVLEAVEKAESEASIPIGGSPQNVKFTHPLAVLQHISASPEDLRQAKLMTVPRMASEDDTMAQKEAEAPSPARLTQMLHYGNQVAMILDATDVNEAVAKAQRAKLAKQTKKKMKQQALEYLTNNVDKQQPETSPHAIDPQRSDVIIQIVDENRNVVKRISPINMLPADPKSEKKQKDTLEWLAMAETDEGELVTLQRQGPHGLLRLYQVDHDALTRELAQWMEMHGLPANAVSAERVTISSGAAGQDLLQLHVQGGAGGLSENPPKVESPKHGKEDPENTPHVGGNTWAGGTGGSNTAGLGGRGGPYRLDKGHPVHQVTDAAKQQVDDATKQQARELNRKAFAERLQEIEMTEDEHEQYATFLGNVEQEISQLRVVLDAAEKKKQEREWLKNETFGDLDDSKLVDCALGERLVYKRRGVRDPVPGAVQELPKRLLFLLDCSGSMYRFNSQDGRLRRECELAVMIMEALEPFADRYKYSIVGHSGESEAIKLVKFGEPPRTRKDKLRVCQHMIAHAQYCWSGDMTLEGTEAAIKVVDEEDADQKLVIVVSDANLRRYGIPASELGRRLIASPDVEAHALFIASFGEEAQRLKRELPPGRGHVLLDMSQLPNVFREILITNVVNP